MLVEKSFDTEEVVLNYSEGPPNGPPLVLLPGGTMRSLSHWAVSCIVSDYNQRLAVRTFSGCMAIIE